MVGFVTERATEKHLGVLTFQTQIPWNQHGELQLEFYLTV